MHLLKLHFLIVTFAVQCSLTHCAADDTIDFSREVRPILAKNCFKCHGPDAETREADLRLDLRDSAIKERGGHSAIVPGEPAQSEVVKRITSNDESEKMPPVDSDLNLTDAEIATLVRWIEQGAEYTQHWAFRKPDQTDPPRVESDWIRNPIDQFALARMNEQGLQPSPEADKYALIRRVYLDLIGLPPTPEEADAFVNSDDPNAYAELVDQLLKSPQYGERWARLWLDLARYADTNGYEKDRPRTIWPYRDWVINSINADMPYDQFTIEQLAGDMLPEPTIDQLIATGFHRNTMLNEEGGIDPLEYRFYAMVDRVATTGTVWLGMTIGCAQCHTHKFDPITHDDYYGLMAYLNNADEPDLIISAAATEQSRQKILSDITTLESQLAEKFPVPDGEGSLEERRQKNLQEHFTRWTAEQKQQSTNWEIARPIAMTTNLPRLELLEDGSILSTGDITKRDVFELTFPLDESREPMTAIRLEVLPDDRLPARGPGRAFYEGRKGDFFLSELTAERDESPVKLAEASHSFGKISIGSGSADAANVLDGDGSTGWSTATREGEAHQLVVNVSNPVSGPGDLKLKLLFERHFAASLGRFRISFSRDTKPAQASQLPVELEAKLNETESIDEELRQALLIHFLRTTPELAEARKPIDELRVRLPDPTTTMIFEERPEDHPRLTYRHHRGEFLSTREEVIPHLPDLFAEQSVSLPTNRLEFAKWLVSNDNPLIGRVTVNRDWQAFFGQGLVRTTEDFGTQSSFPSHPELLDWLALAFTSNDKDDEFSLKWSRKELHRMIVTSATYRQSSAVNESNLATDPENIFLSRGPRVRLDAELIRDSILKSSGLLSLKIGGPSVYPPQPESVVAVAYGNPDWPISQGEDRYRRSLYTFSKRTAPFAAFTVFDAPTGENCIVRRDRSNTPLQALTLLNDEMFLEAARAAAKSAATPEREESQIATDLFRRFLTRQPTHEELISIHKFYDSQLARLRSGELDAATIAGKEEQAPERAAWVMVARVIMNLDEAVTKP